MRRGFLYSIIFLVGLVLMWYDSSIFVFLLLINFGFHYFQLISQLWLAYRKKRTYTPLRKKKNSPFISIHIPICDEPPEIVIPVIESCLNQTYSNFEIIVFDNNSSQEANWKPVQEFCASHNKVKFFHQKKLKGFKAGALDFCRKKSHPSTRYVFTVDADYMLDRKCLSIAIRYMTNSKLAVVQFPQAYYNASEQNFLVKEFEHYFNTYANGGNKKGTALPTGTLTFISIKALDQVGGWKSFSLTEDANLGIKLRAKGYKLRYIPKIVGKGLIPSTTTSICKQRNRWIYGNMQCLIKLMKNRRLQLNDKFIISVQLSAWINFLGFPSLVLVLTLISRAFNQSMPLQTMVQICLGHYLLYILIKLLIFKKSHSSNNDSWIGAFFVHLSFAGLGAFDWWPVIFGYSKRFIRTNKKKKRSKKFNISPAFFASILLCTNILFFSQLEFFTQFLFSLITSLWVISNLVFYKQFLNNSPSLKKVTS